MTAADVEIIGSGSISAGTASVEIYGAQSATNLLVGSGTMPGGWSGITLSANELSRVTCSGMKLQTSAGLQVGALAVSDTDQIAGTVSLHSKAESITFTGGASNYQSLSAKAKCGITVSSDISTTGTMILDGDFETCGVSANGKVTLSDTVTLLSAGILTLKADQAGAVQSGVATLKSTSGISLDSKVTNTADGTKTLVLHVDTSGVGTLTITSGHVVDTGGHNLVITTGDLDLSGSISTGAGLLDIYGATSSTSIQLGSGSGDLSITGAELQRMTSSGGMKLSTSSTLTVNAISTTNSQYVTATTTLLALSSSPLSFGTSTNTFHTLYADASNDNIQVGTSISTTTGSLTLKASTIDIAQNSVLTGATQVKLEAPNGATCTTPITITQVSTPAASVSDLGVHLKHGLTASGTGDLTIQTQGILKLENTNVAAANANLIITAADLQLDSVATLTGISSGNAITMYAPQSGTQVMDIGVGSPNNVRVQTLMVTTDEISRLTSTSGLSLIGGLSGDVKVGGITETSVSNCGPITLVSSNVIEFNSYGSTFNTVNLHASNGLDFKKHLHTASADMVLTADYDSDGTGTLTLDAGIVLTAPGQAISIIASDIELDETDSATGIGTSTTTSLTVTTSTSKTVGLGVTSTQMKLSLVELQRLTATDLTIGDASCSGMTLEGVTQQSTQYIGGLVTLISNGATAFSGTSVFPALSATANTGITLGGSVTTTSGHLVLDGDLDNSGTDALTFSGGAVVAAQSVLSLRASTGGGVAQGTLTLEAGAGIGLDSGIRLESSTSSDKLVINADSQNLGTGAALVIDSAGSSLGVTSADQTILITAADIDMKTTPVIKSTSGGNVQLDCTAASMSLGSSSAADWTLSTSELQRITATDLTITNQQVGNMEVGALATAVTSSISGVLKLVSQQNIDLSAGDSTFSALTVEAKATINIAQNIHTTAGSIVLTANSDGTGAAVDNTLTIGASNSALTTLKSALGSISLGAQTGGISVQGGLTLDAKTGVTLLHSVGSTGNLFFEADSDAASDGTFTLSTGATVTTNNMNMDITASSINLQGSIACGAGSTTLLHSTVGGEMHLGAVSGSLFSLTDAELGRITASDLIIGDTNNGNILVSQLTLANNHITSKISLNAKKVSSLVRVTGASSISSELDIIASNGIDLTQDLTLQSTATLNSDFTAGGVGKFTIATGASLSTTGQQLMISTSDVVLDGGISSGTGAVLVQVVEPSRVISIDATASSGMVVTSTELQRISTNGLSIGGSVNGAITVKQVTAAESAHISGILTLLATKTGAAVAFSDTSASTFNTLSIQSDAGISVATDITAIVGNIVMDGGSGTTSFTSALTLKAQSQESLRSGGGITASNALTLQANDGITVGSSLVTTGALTIDADTNSNDDVGTLTLNSTATVSSQNQLLTITAADVDFDGSISAGTSVIILTPTNNRHVSLGPSLPVNFSLSATEMSRMTSLGAVIGGASTGHISVSELGNSAQYIQGIVTLTTPRESSHIQFLGSVSSTFHSLAVQAEDSVYISSDIFSSTGDIEIDGNLNGDADGGITMYDNRAGDMQLQCANCERKISAGQALTLSAIEGVSMIGFVTASSVTNLAFLTSIYGYGGQVALSSDSNMDGAGSLSLGATIYLVDQNLVLSAADMTISAAVSVGTANITLQASHAATITLGQPTSYYIANKLEISEAELALLNCSTLLVGDTRNSGILVSNVTNLNNGIDWVVLDSSNTSGNVSFVTAASSFPNLQVLSGNGVYIATNLTTNNCVINSDGDGDQSGQLSVSANQTLLVSGNGANLSCSGLSLDGTLQATDADVRIQPARSRGTAALGELSSSTADVTLARGPLGRVIAKKLLFGGTSTGNINVGAVYSDDIHTSVQNVLILAQTAGSTITFGSTGTNFPDLEVRAHGGISINGNITTVGQNNNLYINADDDNARRSGDGILRIAAGLTLTSGGSLTLVSHSGGIWPAGPIKLKSKCGITLSNKIRGPYIEYVTYETDSGCAINVAEEPLNLWILAMVLVLLLIPCVITCRLQCIPRAPLKPLTDGVLLVLQEDGPGPFWDEEVVGTGGFRKAETETTQLIEDSDPEIEDGVGDNEDLDSITLELVSTPSQKQP